MRHPLSRRTLLAVAAVAPMLASAPAFALPQARPDRAALLAAMKRATRFMVDEASVGGGYVWSALPDFSRRWGELEAALTMIWVQPPGTATMGHLFLDAWRATGDEDYFAAAAAAGRALVRGQHPSGGWDYVIDTAGEDSLKRWYGTYGQNAWRMEEFHHHYGNATFDDAGTAEASQLMLRLYLAKREREWRRPLDRAIAFVLDSQYANGGWPQRFPLSTDAGLHGRPNYTGYITFNDDVAGENIKFLIFAYQTLGDRRLVAPIRRAMDCFLACQQPAPQAGWGLQHLPDTLKPSAARTYEPEALATHTTAANVEALFGFYRLTGDRKYIGRVPEALDWLESVRLPARLHRDGRTHPTFVEPTGDQQAPLCASARVQRRQRRLLCRRQSRGHAGPLQLVPGGGCGPAEGRIRAAGGDDARGRGGGIAPAGAAGLGRPARLFHPRRHHRLGHDQPGDAAARGYAGGSGRACGGTERPRLLAHAPAGDQQPLYRRRLTGGGAGRVSHHPGRRRL